mgnify:CR=1 FL=1
MDCAGARGLRFPALPVKPEPETVFLMRDPSMVILLEDHPLQDLEAFPVEALCKEPFLLPEKGGKAEISGIFEHSCLTPHVPFPTWGNDAILAMRDAWFQVASIVSTTGFATTDFALWPVLPQLVLRRIPYRAAIRPLFSRLS